MFCPNCGSPISEGSKFCMNCGTPVAVTPVAPAVQAQEPEPVKVPEVPVQPEVPAQPPVQPQAPVQPQQPVAPQYTQPEAPQYTQPAAPVYGQPAAPQYAAPAYGAFAPAKKPVNKKLIGIIIGAVAVVAAIVVTLILVLGGDDKKSDKETVSEKTKSETSSVLDVSEDSPSSKKSQTSSGSSSVKKNSSAEDAAKKYVKATYAYDVDLIFECCPDFELDYLADMLGMTKSEFRDYIDEQSKSLEVYNVTVIGCEEEELEDDDYYDVTEEIKETYELSSSEMKKITDVKLMNVDYVMDGEEESDEVVCIKYNGAWYAIDI